MIMIAHETESASALMAYFHDTSSLPESSLPKRQSPDQQPEQASNQGDGCEGRDNPQIDQYDTCPFHNVSDPRPSGGETGDARFEVGHLSARDKSEFTRVPNRCLLLLAITARMSVAEERGRGCAPPKRG